jgi:hypothetical protein
MRLVLYVYFVGIVLVVAAIWHGPKERIVAMVLIALAALVTALIREKF